MAKKHITAKELESKMWEFNALNPDKQESACISGVIVFKQSNFEKQYSEESRSYRVWNCNRAFQSGKIANSLFGSCLDGTDQGVRLDWYNWEPEFAYMD